MLRRTRERSPRQRAVKLMTAKQAAKAWGVSARNVRFLLARRMLSVVDLSALVAPRKLVLCLDSRENSSRASDATIAMLQRAERTLRTGPGKTRPRVAKPRGLTGRERQRVVKKMREGAKAEMKSARAKARDEYLERLDAILDRVQKIVRQKGVRQNARRSIRARVREEFGGGCR